MKKIVITSGFFNPIHVGHMNLMREAKKLGDFLVVIVNNDSQVKIKGSVPFMPEQERAAIIKDIKYVDEVFLSIDRDGFVPESLKAVVQKYPGEYIFAKGGDRNFDNLPESEKKVCQEFNITIINGVGGQKVQSSSWLLNKTSKDKP
ncbi:MAG: cytidyltransferase [Candidatus Staskawiczbacteria bacterium]|nr:cytidyltransferase [Candidatus Staskawiczbacteria bacterium]